MKSVSRLRSILFGVPIGVSLYVFLMGATFILSGYTASGVDAAVLAKNVLLFSDVGVSYRTDQLVMPWTGYLGWVLLLCYIACCCGFIYAGGDSHARGKADTDVRE